MIGITAHLLDKHYEIYNMNLEILNVSRLILVNAGYSTQHATLSMCGVTITWRTGSSPLLCIAAVCPWHEATWRFATQCIYHRAAPDWAKETFPLLVWKQHCRSVLWCWCHTSSDKTACAFSPSVMVIAAPSNSDKKPHINGHASPSHLPSNISNNHAGKQSKSHFLLRINSFFLSPLICM